MRTTVTMKHVAREAGVSAGTVSAILRGKRDTIFYSDETRTRVMGVVDRLGYRVNLAARSLREGRTRTVGVLIDDITLPFFSSLVRAASLALHAQGYAIVLCGLEGAVMDRGRLLDLLQQRQPDALLLAGALARLSDQDLLAIHGAGRRLVLVERDPPGPGIAAVGVDNAEGGRLAAGHMLARGRRSFLVLSGPEDNPMARRRADGALAALRDAGVPAGRLAVRPAAGWTAEDGLAAMRAALAGGVRPDALIAGNDLLAIGAMQAARERGLAVPGDLAVIGFDDMPLAAFAGPPLTTIRQPAGEMGRAAADLLAGGPAGDGPSRIFTPELVVRTST